MDKVLKEYFKEKEELRNEAIVAAAVDAGLSRHELNSVFENEGIVGVYNLGLRHMYDYLSE